MNDQGQVARGPTAATLSEAARHASSLRAELRRRSTHPEVLRYCTLEILAKNPFHASLEAVKSVTDRLRQLTDQRLDGARLVDAVVMPGQGTARVAINANATGPTRSSPGQVGQLHPTVRGSARPPRQEPPAHPPVVSSDPQTEACRPAPPLLHRLPAGALVSVAALPPPPTHPSRSEVRRRPHHRIEAPTGGRPQGCSVTSSLSVGRAAPCERLGA
ncbi:TIGR02391 family protein [Streptomyces sp. P3]|uniref:TIGR02391 family protein n=1 Tax=Streptomyces sp. P3 TaxID=2135430 RepID=UPI0034676530